MLQVRLGRRCGRGGLPVQLVNAPIDDALGDRPNDPRLHGRGAFLQRENRKGAYNTGSRSVLDALGDVI